jgi:transcriptional regulator with XRE-family HTH domain
MPSPQALAQARRVADRAHSTLAGELRRLREDAGVTRAQLARTAAVDLAYLCRIEDGREHPSMETYARLAAPLGADLAAHLYPSTGPTIRDRLQARILEALLGQLHPRWEPFTEVAVRRPARGWIDVLLHDGAARLVIATEIESTLSRLEQMVRWSSEKAASLPSWEGYDRLGEIGATSRLLIARSTRTTRQVGRDFARQLEVAYPAHPADALDALRGTRPWPGPTLIWASVDGPEVRFSPRRASERARG